MAKGTFEAAFKLVLKHEGGYVDHPSDPGGATNLGVTIGTLSNWLGRKATKAEVKALTPATVKPIYRRNYWDAVRGDELPTGVDYAAFDYAVNSGPSRAAKHLQEVVGVAQDGKIGPITLAAIKNRSPEAVINALCDRRMKFLRSLSTFGTFGRGWTRRVDEVRRDALGMAKAANLATQPSKPSPAPSARPNPQSLPARRYGSFSRSYSPPLRPSSSSISDNRSNHYAWVYLRRYRR